MTTISDERLAEMLAGLEGVTPGPWVPGYYEDGDPDGGPNGEFYPDGSILSVHEDGSCEHVDPWKEVVAKHIARCDPDTMRSILTELQSLRAQGGVRAKPLEWPNEIKRGQRVMSGHGLIQYTICHYGGDDPNGGTVYRWAAQNEGWHGPLFSYQDAIAAAQADYKRRILSSLEASPAEAGAIAARARIAEVGPVATLIDSLTAEELAADRSDENPNVGRVEASPARMARNGLPCCKDIRESGMAETDEPCRLCIEASPAPVSDLSVQDLQLLERLKRDNVWDGARPVLEGPRTDPETEQAFRLSEQGYIALEQVARGVRLHITRKGVAALTAALAAKGGQ